MLIGNRHFSCFNSLDATTLITKFHCPHFTNENCSQTLGNLPKARIQMKIFRTFNTMCPLCIYPPILNRHYTTELGF